MFKAAKRVRWCAAMLVAVPSLVQAVTGTITGTVKDDRSGTPLAGVTVTVKGTKVGALSGEDGVFAVTGVPAGRQTIVANRLGLATAVRPGVEVTPGGTTRVEIAMVPGLARMDEVVVSGSKLRTEVAHTPTAISILTQAELQKTPLARDVNDVLQQVPGLMVTPAPAGLPVDGSFSTRGGEPSAWGVRFLVDGIEINKGNGYVVPPRVPINDVDQIEVTKTPSAIYGDQAIGGVINLVTRVSDQPLEGKIGASRGSFATERYYTVLNGSQGRWEYFVDFTNIRRDGYQDGARESDVNVYTRLGYDLDERTRLSFYGSHFEMTGAWPNSLSAAQFADDPRQNPGSPQPLDNDYDLGAVAYERTFDSGDLRLRLTGKDEVVDMVWNGAAFLFDEWEVYPEATYTWRNDAVGVGNTTVIGLEARYHEIITKLALDSGAGAVLRNSLRKDLTVAGYLQNELRLTPQLTAVAGLRIDRFSQEQEGRQNPGNTFDQSDVAISPKLGVTYTLSRAANLFAGFNSGYKSPARVPAAAFAEGLKPEVIRSYEAGVRGTPLPVLTYSAAAFLVQADDKFVDSGPEPDDPYINAGSTSATGFELTLLADMGTGPYGSLSYTYQKAEFDDFTDGGVVLDGNRLPDLPEHLAGASLGYRSDAVGNLSVSANYMGEKYFNTANTLVGGGYWLVNASYRRTLMAEPGVELFLSAENLADEVAIVAGGGNPGAESYYPVSGRGVFAGLEMSF